MKTFFTTEAQRSAKANDILICRSCGKILCRLGEDILAGKMSIICRCGTLNSFKSTKSIAAHGTYAVRAGHTVVCPKCGLILVRFHNKNICGSSFRIACSCGSVYDKAVESKKKERRIGTFASLE